MFHSKYNKKVLFMAHKIKFYSLEKALEIVQAGQKKDFMRDVQQAMEMKCFNSVYRLFRAKGIRNIDIEKVFAVNRVLRKYNMSDECWTIKDYR